MTVYVETLQLPWTERFRPKTRSDLVGNNLAIDRLKRWMEDWGREIAKGEVPKKRSVLLYGPPGIGKTASVEALANDLGFDLFELNASDHRTSERIQRYIGRGKASVWSPQGRKRMVLIDEVDGSYETREGGGVSAILTIAKETRAPLILVANNAFHRRLRPLREISMCIEFKRPRTISITERLQDICNVIGLRADQEALRLIAERSEGDLRSAIADLQAVAVGRREVRYEDVRRLVGSRNRKEKIFDVIRDILKGKGSSKAINQVYVDGENLFEWIHENVPYQITDPEDLWAVMEKLSEADIYLRRSSPRMGAAADVNLTKYFYDLMTVGFSVVKQSPTRWERIRTPERRSRMSRTKARREIERRLGGRIGRRCHTSIRRALREFVPFLKVIFQNNERAASGLVDWLDLDEESANLLRN